MDFGERLRKLRKGKYSQEELATLLKIHSNTISKWENGEMEPRSARVKQLAEIFHTTSAYLLGETDNPEPERTLPIEEPTEHPQALKQEAKSRKPLDATDKSIFEAIKSNAMLVYEKDNERIFIPATPEGFKFLRELKKIKTDNKTNKTL